MARSAALLTLLAIVTSTGAGTEVPLGQLPRHVTPQRYRLSFTLLPGEDTFRGHAEIDVRLERTTRTLYLHGHGLSMHSAVLRAGDRTIPLAYHEVDPSGVARGDLATPIGPGAATLVFDYSAAFQKGANGVYRFNSGGIWHVATQFQPTAARRAFPGIDEPAYKTPFEIDITTSPGLVVASNARLIATEAVAEGLLRHRFAPTAPLPTYLIALAAGGYEVAEVSLRENRWRDRPLKLRALAPRGQGHRLSHALRETPVILEQLEEYFGSAYPFDKLDLLASPAMGGGMENAGLITFRDTLLLLDEGATPEQQSAFAIAIAHELAHQWFGNLVTPMWWDDLWLNESFAKWIATRMVMRWRPELDAAGIALEETHQAMDADVGVAAQPVNRRVRTASDIAGAFDKICYFKGARILAMLERYVGEERFRDVIRDYLQRFRFGSARSDDFVESVLTATRRPEAAHALRRFISQPGLPLVTIERRAGGVTLMQSRFRLAGAYPAAETRWILPICLRTGVLESCAELRGHARTLAPADSSGALVANAGGAGYYRFSLSEAEWVRAIDLIDSMPVTEALATLDSLWAEFTAGRTPFGYVLHAMRRAALHPSARVATKLGGRIAEMGDRILAPELAPAVRQLLIDIYQPRLEAIGYSVQGDANAEHSFERRLARRSLVVLLAIAGRDPLLRDRLRAAAHAFMAGEERALDPQYRFAALVAAVQDSSPAFVQRLIESLAVSPDPAFRQDAARALGTVANTAKAVEVLRALDDRRLQNMDVTEIVRALLGRRETRQLAFSWLLSHFESFAARLPTLGKFQIVGIAVQVCDVESGAELARGLKPHLSAVDGGERELAAALERVSICSTFKRQHGPEVERALLLATRRSAS